jgi:hypothetical protein
MNAVAASSRPRSSYFAHVDGPPCTSTLNALALVHGLP